ncbi:phosphatase PAP2 family protein [Antarcticirhabdus aurantiaca]|uniref:Phosphatase PAP2 family protein n=1 Tax=Antarcticirhabdus aurantiaca TaxID=2606717 RepID=A0ACD4NQ63_9HYPH|nr:phosphatase PAP2 family protein [Antarcticirhabdus aurantiaca]WAJ28909.1 phosphatase PAP2 family protein [Jeongeuplla avenae]
MSLDQAAAKNIEDLDRQVAERAARRRHHPVIRALGWASEIADQPQLATVCGLTAAAGLMRGDRRLMSTGILMLLAHGFATFFKSMVKSRVNRTRPSAAIEDGRYEMGLGESRDRDDQSFPSGHTAGAVAVAGIVAMRHPGAAIPASALAIAASVIQVPRGKHYPGDLAAGLAIGLAAAGITLAIGNATGMRR